MVCLRKAVEADIPKLYSYLNKKYVERNLKNSVELEEKYKEWYKEIIGSKKFVLLIIEDENKNFIGHIKYKVFSKKTEVMIFIVEEHRNCGIGKEALESSFMYIDSNKIIVAKILEENQNSKKLFERLGFVYYKQEKEFDLYIKNCN